ncbi:Satratoxin biosynthesis SC1 cluster protein 4 [Paramyrothecium foliicola]|nr:Satratoxin biosynthesis SC1 cluster protein 4 [Paramyrothecium foliicola]
MADSPSNSSIVALVPPPPGVTVDFDNPRSRFVLLHYLIFAIGGFLAFVALLQRYYAKLFLSKGLQIDDLFMSMAWLASVTTQALSVWSIARGGLCHHIWEMPVSVFEEYSLVIYITAPVFQLCNGFAKLTLLTFYLRLGVQTSFRIAVWSTIVAVTLYTITITFLMFFQCTPIHKAFNPLVGGGSCINAAGLYIATAATNIATDMVLFILPLPMIFSMHLPLAQKIGAVFVFAIGSLTIATSCVRLAYLPSLLKSQDFPWDAALANVWTFGAIEKLDRCEAVPWREEFHPHPPRDMRMDSTSTRDNRWKENDERQTYCVVGPPGYGKACIYIKLIDHIEVTSNATVMFFLFCFADREFDSTTSLLRSWSWQLVARFDEARRCAVQAQQSSENHLCSASEIRKLFFEIIKSAPACYLTVDAGDECTDQEEVVELLKNIPQKLKLFVTSRPFAYGVQNPKDGLSTTLEITEDMNRADIDTKTTGL